MTIDFGLLLPIGPQKDDPASFVRNIGAYAPLITGHIDHLWMTDHFQWDDNPMYECWTVLSFLAGQFPTLKFGPMVLGQNYRNPALLAKMGATLHHMSDGRFIMGLGAGWNAGEYHAYNYHFPRSRVRVWQLEEAVIIIKRLWYDAGPSTFEGHHYAIYDAYCEPRPAPPPPIVIGGSGDHLLGVVAQHADWWNHTDPTLAGYRLRRDVLHGHCEVIGRDPASLRLTWMPHLALGHTLEQAKALAPELDADVHLVGPPTLVAERIAPFIELGVQTIVFEMHGLPNPDLTGLLTEELLPLLRNLCD